LNASRSICEVAQNSRNPDFKPLRPAKRKDFAKKLNHSERKSKAFAQRFKGLARIFEAFARLLKDLAQLPKLLGKCPKLSGESPKDLGKLPKLLGELPKALAQLPEKVFGRSEALENPTIRINHKNH
jgi:hypothetical protein